jgi:hypothetical protein
MKRSMKELMSIVLMGERRRLNTITKIVVVKSR